MSHTLKTEIVVLYVLVVVLLAGYAGLNIAAKLAVRDAAVRGAKIGIAASTPDAYRVNEVRGACEDVFTADECIMCHEF